MKSNIICAICACLLSLGAAAQQKPDQKKIDEAIERGVKHLKRIYGETDRLDELAAGGPQGGAMRYHELVALTLVHAGLTESDTVVADLVDAALQFRLKHTYVVSLQAMLLNALDPSKYQSRIAQCAQFLADNQCKNGQWSYGEPIGLENLPRTIDTEKGSEKPKKGETKALKKISVKKRANGPETGDNSNSQYAALGLRACFDSGIAFESGVITKAKEWWEKSQCGDGSWDYGMTKQNKAPLFPGADSGYGSMTAGALGAMCIYNHMLRLSFKSDSRIQRGFKWLSDNFDVKSNPGAETGRQESWNFYYLYALERAGILYGAEKIGSHDWYSEGANYLLKAQNKDGSWGEGRKEKGPNGGIVADTCFAILFLRRATRPLIDTEK